MITKRRFINYLRIGRPYKFWNCWHEDKTYFTEWGRVGEPATMMKARPCSSESEAAQKMAELAASMRERSYGGKYIEIDSVKLETVEEAIRRRLRGKAKRKKRPSVGLLEERFQRSNLERWLITEGWVIQAQEKRTAVTALTAVKGDEKWVIVLKGYRQNIAANRRKYCLALGTLVSMMDDDKANYFIAFADVVEDRALWSKLPSYTRIKIDISGFFVDAAGNVDRA